MPQNIVVGENAKQVAAFLEKWSGKSAKRPPRPGGQPTTGQQQQPGQTTP
jgi:hypothetical protein